MNYSPPPSPHYGNSYPNQLYNYAIKRLGSKVEIDSNTNSNVNVNLSSKRKSKKNVLAILKYSRIQKKKRAPKRKLPKNISLDEVLTQVKNLRV
jgi:hypothetical protein